MLTVSSLDARFPGGSEAFARQPPNSTYRSDGVLAGVTFMVPDDARAFTLTLTKHGFADPWVGETSDIAVIDQRQGFLTRGGLAHD